MIQCDWFHLEIHLWLSLIVEKHVQFFVGYFTITYLLIKFKILLKFEKTNIFLEITISIH